jgi:hypothetical protein
MALTFQNGPYWDDFDTNKNFHRILFKPGYAVQARELTQAQTILQNQITKFGNHIFKNHSIVSGAGTTLNFSVYFLKLEPFDQFDNEIVAADFRNVTVTNSDGTIVAKVVHTAEKFVDNTGAVIDPPTLILSYISGDRFNNGDTVIVVDTDISAVVIDGNSIYQPSTGKSSIASVSDGVMYIDGYFVSVQEQTVSVDEYTDAPSARVGLSISENVFDYNDDPSLLDPALGSSNFQAPGADRYKIQLTLISKPLAIDEDDTFIELLRIDAGKLLKSVRFTEYSIIDDYFARRTFDTNGDFISEKFKLTTESIPSSSNTFLVKVGPGKAFVRGYVVENQSDASFTCHKARDYNTVENSTMFMGYGNYLYCDTVTGLVDQKGYQTVDFHVVKTPASLNNTSSPTYIATKAGTAKIRGMDFQFAPNSANSKSFIYKMSFVDIQTTTLRGYSANTYESNNSIALPSTFSATANAYKGLYITIDSGVNAGDLLQIVSYDGVGKVAQLNKTFRRTVEANVEFTILFTSKDFESFYAQSNTVTKGIINNSSKTNGVDSGDVVFANVGEQELIYPFENSFVKQNSVNNSNYHSWIRFTNKPINGSIQVPGTGVMEFEVGTDGVLDVSQINENFICVIRSPGTSGLAYGDIVTFGGTSTDGITISSSSSTATINKSTWTSTTLDIYAKVWIVNGNDQTYVKKTKTVVSANVSSVNYTGTQVTTNVHVDLVNAQVYYKKGTFNTTKQSLYIADARRIIKIIDTQLANTVPTTDMLSNPLYDVTRYYSFDDGQRDNYYDHSSLALINGSPAPKGNLLVLLSYFSHSGGDGFFIGDSYINVPYENIPRYISKTGKTYNLRDSIDFRPKVKNANATFAFEDSVSSSPIGIPVDGTNFITDYSYYIGRKDIIVISKDKNISLIEGVSSINPKEPKEPDGSIIIGRLTHEPYTSFIPGDDTVGTSSSLNLQFVNHKRWRMEDITSLEERVNRLEYYSSLSNIEQSAKSLQIPDEFGNNRFKNGILTDDFSSYKVADAYSQDLACSISQAKRKLFARTDVANYPLFLRDALYSNGVVRDSDDLNYKVHYDGVISYATLPYSTMPLATQPYATGTVNLNPFMFIGIEGVCYISPSIDNWISTSRLPDILISSTDPGFKVSVESNTNNVFADYQTITSTERPPVTTTSEIQFKTNTTEYNDPTRNFPSRMTEDEVLDFYTLYGSEAYSGGKPLFTTAILGLVPPLKTKPIPNGVTITNWGSGGYLGHLQFSVAMFLWEKHSKTGLWSGIGTTSLTSVSTSTVTQTTDVKIWGNWQNVTDTFEQNNGFVTDVSMNPYIRSQQIQFVAKDLLVNSPMSCFFDGVDVSNRIRQSNIIEVNNTILYSNIRSRLISPTQAFQTGDVLAYYDTATSSYKKFAIVVNVHTNNSTEIYNSANVNIGVILRQKLDLGSDVDSTIYFKNTNLNSNVFALIINGSGATTGIKAKANLASIYKVSGKIKKQYGSNQIVIPRTYSGEFTNNQSKYVGRDLFVIYPDMEISYRIASGREDNTNNEIVLMTDNTSIITANSIANAIFDIKPVNPSGRLRSDKVGAISGTLYLPGNQFKTGEKIFRVDNRTGGNSGTETTFAQTKFFASSLNVQKQNLNFSSDPSKISGSKTTSTSSNTVNTVKQTYASTKIVNYVDPVCQSFIVYSNEAPNGAFVKSAKLFFKTKPTTHNSPVTVSILETINGYPSGDFLPHSTVVLNTDEIKVSESPNMEDESTWTEFTFPVPVYIRPETMYALLVRTNSNEYFIWTAELGEFALSSTAGGFANYKIAQTPYIGELFLSQNTITWAADQNKDLMFQLTRCDFDITKNPSIDFVVPTKLPQRHLVDNSLSYSDDANTSSDFGVSYTTNQNREISAFNVTASDLTFDVAPITYTYKATIKSPRETEVFPHSITPGKYGTATYDDIYLDDGKGERILIANSANSFVLTATLSSRDSLISPVISESGTTLYGVKWAINDLGLANNNFIVIDGGTGYSNSSVITITRTSNTTGENAIVNPVVKANGVIDRIDVIYAGSGYASTPTITIDDPYRSGNSNAEIIIVGETSYRGGNALLRYVTKPVTLAAGFDAGDIRVYFTAYRPVNSDIYVYYKILDRNDIQQFGDSDWQLMTMISGDYLYSSSRNDLREFVAAPGRDLVADNKVSYVSKSSGETFVNFYQFAIKIVLSSPDSTRVPYLIDLRAIALPEAI